ncbi:aminoacetone oxidase family FAD-binding enzyme [Bacteroidia bacterium]|nr:aminoacetone oxidase family FAD-binding enzyme [Bacteroidia bacterium]
MEYDVIVIGAGAAGLMAAGEAALEGHSVLVLEKMEKAARKVRISGKGRCNLTNTRPREEFLEKVRSGRDFFAPAFDQFDNRRTFTFFRKQGVPLEVERGERVFPRSGKAWDIANALVEWVEESGAKIEYHTSVERILTVGGQIFGVEVLNRKGFVRKFECSKIILATGGASYPSTGSTGDGYRLAHDLGHSIEPIRPSLVALVSSLPAIHSLEGMSLRNVGARLVVDGQTVREEFGELDFSSRGVEGAVILRVSRDAVDALIDGHRVEVELDLKPALDVETLRERIVREREALPDVARLGELLRKLMPAPLVEVIAAEVGRPSSARMNSLDQSVFERVIELLKRFTLPIDDYGPFDQAVVTAGGISLEEVDPQTLQSRILPGLYLAGEVLDIDADTGGYNLQIAFSTGRLAGRLLGSTKPAKS